MRGIHVVTIPLVAVRSLENPKSHVPEDNNRATLIIIARLIAQRKKKRARVRLQLLSRPVTVAMFNTFIVYQSVLHTGRPINRAEDVRCNR